MNILSCCYFQLILRKKKQKIQRNLRMINSFSNFYRLIIKLIVYYFVKIFPTYNRNKINKKKSQSTNKIILQILDKIDNSTICGIRNLLSSNFLKIKANSNAR